MGNLNVTFKAQYMSPAYIKKLGSNGSYSKNEVSFVKIEPGRETDVAAVDTIRKTWFTNNCIVLDILYDINDFNKKREDGFITKESLKRNFYAITTQDKKFSHLEPEKILGIAEYSERKKSYGYIDFIQVNPKNITKKYIKPEICGVGTAILDSIKNIAKSRNIYLNSLPEAMKFYIKNGFTFVEQNLSNPLMVFKR